MCHFSSRRRVAGKDPSLGQASQAAVEAFPLQAGSGCRRADGSGRIQVPCSFLARKLTVPKSVQRQSRQGPAGFQVAVWPSLFTDHLSQSGKPGCALAVAVLCPQERGPSRRRSCWASPFSPLLEFSASLLVVPPPVNCCKWFFPCPPASTPTRHAPYSEIGEQVEGQLCKVTTEPSVLTAIQVVLPDTLATCTLLFFFFFSYCTVSTLKFV